MNASKSCRPWSRKWCTERTDRFDLIFLTKFHFIQTFSDRFLSDVAVYSYNNWAPWRTDENWHHEGVLPGQVHEAHLGGLRGKAIRTNKLFRGHDQSFRFPEACTVRDIRSTFYIYNSPLVNNKSMWTLYVNRTTSFTARSVSKSLPCWNASSARTFSVRSGGPM